MDITILDTSFISIKVLDSYESLIWTDRYNSYGDFELVLLTDTSLLAYLLPDNYLMIDDSDYLMIIEDVEINSRLGEDGTSSLLIRGRSLESILDRRIVWGQKVLTGNFQTAIQTLLNENIINPSITDRKINNFTFSSSTDPNITSLAIDLQLYGDNLYSVISNLCIEMDIGFKVSLTGSGNFEFKLYAGVDRSYNQITYPHVIFSPNFENLLNSNYNQTKKNLKTVTFIAGEGEGAARLTTTANSSAGAGSGINRREIYTDGSSLSKTVDGGTLTDPEYILQLQQEGLKILSQNIIQSSFEGTADTTIIYIYDVDYFMGDIVQIINEYGLQSFSRIVEMIRSIDASGYKIYPTFSNIS